jgi:hypothetical protein
MPQHGGAVPFFPPGVGCGVEVAANLLLVLQLTRQGHGHHYLLGAASWTGLQGNTKIGNQLIS